VSDQPLEDSNNDDIIQEDASDAEQQQDGEGGAIDEHLSLAGEGIIGGLIMFYVLKDEDRKTAKHRLKDGILGTVIWVVLLIISGISTGSRDEDINMGINNRIADCENAQTGTLYYETCWKNLKGEKDIWCKQNPNYDICSNDRIDFTAKWRAEEEQQRRTIN
jgi:hypothetical protein